MSSFKSWIPRPLIIATRRPRRTLVNFVARAPSTMLFVSRRMAGHCGTVLLEPYGVPKNMTGSVLFKICPELGWSLKDGGRYKKGLRLFWPNKETPEPQAYP